MRPVGKALQLVGLALLPLGMIAQLTRAISVGQMLLMLVAGVSAFYVGRIVEGYARS